MLKFSLKAIVLCFFLFASVSAHAIEPVNINTASAASLTALKGIGRSKAQAIVNYRNLNGPFPSISSLVQVRGIGRIILEANRKSITIKN